MNLMLILFFFVSIIFAFGINYLLLKFLKTLGTKNQSPNVQIRWSSQSKPTIGGLSFFAGFLISMIIGLIAPGTIETEPWLAFGVFGSILVAFLMGLADDTFNTKVILKFAIQLSCGLILFFTDNGIDLGNSFISLSLTCFWVIFLMNSINMLDNMDGVSTVVCIPIFFLFGYVELSLVGTNFISFLFLGMTGALLGFLFWNWSPAKIYMGDSGSQILGVMLAIGSIRWGWNAIETQGNFDVLSGLSLASLPLIMTINDTVFVTINRLRQKRSPFVGGRDHTTHNWCIAGLSERTVAILFFVLTSVMSIVAWKALTKEMISNNMIIVILFSMVALSLLLNFYILRKNQSNEQ